MRSIWVVLGSTTVILWTLFIFRVVCRAITHRIDSHLIVAGIAMGIFEISIYGWALWRVFICTFTLESFPATLANAIQNLVQIIIHHSVTGFSFRSGSRRDNVGQLG